ncbi:MAG: hypothetical protein WAT39_25695 [Planctomycetota bacterium]
MAPRTFGGDHPLRVALVSDGVVSKAVTLGFPPIVSTRVRH